jgi:hypothetical protein
MAREPEAVYEISDGLRVAAYQEIEYIDGPFDWGVLFVQTLRKDAYMGELTTNDGHRAAIREIQEHNPFTSFDGYSYERLARRDAWEREAITKHLTRAGFDCTFADLRGYSQGEWLDAVIYAKAGDITDWAGVAEEADAWFRGDVYSLHLERLETYKSQYGNELTQWETLEVYSCNILPNGLTDEIAKEFISNVAPSSVAA